MHYLFRVLNEVGYLSLTTVCHNEHDWRHPTPFSARWTGGYFYNTSSASNVWSNVM